MSHEQAKSTTSDARPPLKCPVCGKPAAAPESATGEASAYPFCSERCKLVDLGRWLDGAYQIPVADDDLDESEIGTDDDPHQ